jgi:DNA-binding protein HU-beta
VALPLAHPCLRKSYKSQAICSITIMTKEEIIEIIAAAHDLPKNKVKAIMGTFFVTVTDAVARGDRVSLQEFGTFASVPSKARVGHNPITGDRIEIAATLRPKFNAAPCFKAKVQNAS